MAQYKVPQDVEADDKLIGPFSFRQFVYLLIAGGLIALAVGLFQLFPLLAIIPVPFILLFAALALPLKKDQPMETYLAAVVSYYLKPHNRVWTPGQRESTIDISAPKVVDDDKTRKISGEEATHRLSFLAEIVDSRGRAISDTNEQNKVQDDLVDEANATSDMFETGHFERLEGTIARDEIERHKEVIKEMRQAIEDTNKKTNSNDSVVSYQNGKLNDERTMQNASSLVENRIAENEKVVENKPAEVIKPEAKSETKMPKPSIIELANNTDFSVATIAKEANRIKEKEDGEVFISLH
ncbi:PrgI family protein [Candidatus Saccharibacteria bacterium]|nr:PrgI family protein [Candidatus Saccharibacteria bacterium]